VHVMDGQVTDFDAEPSLRVKTRDADVETAAA